MSGRLAAPLAELLNVIERQRIAGQVQQAVKKGGAMACREHEAIAIVPIGIARVVFEKARLQYVGHRRCAERQARVSTVRFLHHVH